ncbi:MAG TPA: hypothetical protein VGL71_02975 [Urbifossiella sp.]|jgi:hypothetical protein
MNLKLCALFAIVFAAAGCGGRKANDVHSVSGEVQYDGKAAAGVQVYFMPSKGVRTAAMPANPHATTDGQGRFTLSTFGESDGAPEGEYRVVLIWPKERQDSEESPPDRLFGWYDARHTKLAAKIVPGGNDLQPFKLAAVYGPPPPSEGIPGRN